MHTHMPIILVQIANPNRYSLDFRFVNLWVIILLSIFMLKEDN